jgi:hypothetical protein
VGSLLKAQSLLTPFRSTGEWLKNMIAETKLLVILITGLMFVLCAAW